MVSLVVFTVTLLLRSLEISASIISVSKGEKFKGGTNSCTSANSIVKPNLTIFKTDWSCVIFARFSKQFVTVKWGDFRLPSDFGQAVVYQKKALIKQVWTLHLPFWTFY